MPSPGASGQRLLEECRPEPPGPETGIPFIVWSQPGQFLELFVDDLFELGQALVAKHVGIGGRRVQEDLPIGAQRPPGEPLAEPYRVRAGRLARGQMYLLRLGLDGA